MIDRKRLAHLLAMMGSNADGEALNAARLAERLRKEAGLSWEQLLEERERVVERIVTKDATHEQQMAAHARGFQEGWQAAQQQQYQSAFNAQAAQQQGYTQGYGEAVQNAAFQGLKQKFQAAAEAVYFELQVFGIFCFGFFWVSVICWVFRGLF